jgi:Domain of unknown function (DUF4376)
MDRIGYALVDASGNEVWHVGDTKGVFFSVPEAVPLPNGDVVHGANVGDRFGDLRFVERWIVDAPSSQWHEKTGQTVVFDGQKIIVTVEYAEMVLSKEQLTAYAASVRYNKEIGGITINGLPIATDDRSKQMILGARIASDSDPNFSTIWVGSDGKLYPIDAAGIIGISQAVLGHVNNCFEIFAQVQQSIASGTITTPVEIDAAFGV